MMTKREKMKRKKEKERRRGKGGQHGGSLRCMYIHSALEERSQEEKEEPKQKETIEKKQFIVLYIHQNHHGTGGDQRMESLQKKKANQVEVFFIEVYIH